MTMLQQQAIQMINRIPDEKLKTIIDLMEMIEQPSAAPSKAKSRRVGAAADLDMYDQGYDFDEYNPEIAKMFGVV